MWEYNVMLFNYPELHEMEYDKKTGEWHCLDCERRSSIEKGIIVIGNQLATHVGKTDVKFYRVEVEWLPD